MKKYILIGLTAGMSFALGQALKTHEVEIESIVVGINDDPASGKPQKKEEIPVTVTLTKYQLAKMLEILEEENSYGRPADPQDTYTFYSVAKSYADSKEYNISSTHLAKRLIK